MTAGTDYEVAYSNNINVGTATITITGKGNYTGTITKIFNILPKAIVDGDFTVDTADKTYTGSAFEPAVTSTLVAGTDYEVAYSNNTNAGEATITITGKGNYTGTIAKIFNILAKDIADFTVYGLGNKTYTGSAIEPTVVISWSAGRLVKDTDYTVAYADNTVAGTASVTITGQGNYTGTKAMTFVIVAAPYAGAVTITADTTSIDENTVLTANAPAGDVVTYQWKKDGVDIEGATSNTYTVTAEDSEAEISVVVTSNGNVAGTLESAVVEVGKIVIAGNVTLEQIVDEIIATIDQTIRDLVEQGFADIFWVVDGEEIPMTLDTPYQANEGEEVSVKVVAKEGSDTHTGEVIAAPITVPVTTPASAPSFDAAPVVTTGNSQATVTLAANANGAEILAYTIYVDGAAVATVAGTETAYTITGLTNGTTYQVKVEAVNEVGATMSAETSATPAGGGGHGGVGGGSGSRVNTYAITVKTAENGTVTSSAKNAAKGAVITLKVAANEGYELSALTVTDANGKDVAISEANGTYTFTMPAMMVSVSATFVKAEEDKDDEGKDEPIVTPDTNKFSDVAADAYFGTAVDWAVENGITNGTSETTFSPDVACTRAQMVTFLWRAAGSPKAENAKHKFTDIVEGAYYYDAVLWAVENGITLGTSETTFEPDAIVTRGQTVTFLWRAAGANAVEGEHPFVDVDADAYYESAILWAVANGITTGTSGTAFSPDDACTRAQIVTFIYRYIGK